MSATTVTFPGPGTLTVFLIFTVMVGMTWEATRPFAYFLLIVLLADLLFKAEPNITSMFNQTPARSAGGGGGGGGF